MYRLPVRRQLAFNCRHGAVKVVRRRLTTEATELATPKRRKRNFRRVIWITTGLVGTFYIGSPFLAFKNQLYYDVFFDRVPFGQSMLEFAELRGWDNLTPAKIVENGKNAALTTRDFIVNKINGTEPPKVVEPVKKRVNRTIDEIKTTVVKAVDEVKPKVDSLTSEVKREVQEKVNQIAGGMSAPTGSKEPNFSGELAELVHKVEDALGHPRNVSTSTTNQPPKGPPPRADERAVAERHVYEADLPIGFEPPPGYVRPTSQKRETAKPTEATPISLPLIASAVSLVGVSEPIITHLAGTIDNLASFVHENSSAVPKVTGVLEAAKKDLTILADRIEKAREDERLQLETKLDEQTREYTQRLLELEMEAQDKLDNQEEDFRKFFDHERLAIVKAYRDKLDHELRTQTELINERLKGEVIAQGIELQRRWIREIKVQVEQERGGRLGKLEELSSHLKRLERVALDNSTYLDDNIRIHSLWSAVRALTSTALSAPVRKPFREELRILRHISSAREDPLVSVVLETLESSEVPDIGVEPLADLTSWFTNGVAPKVARVALVPDENAGVMSYLASHLFSSLQFRRQGLVPGGDVLSVVARAEYYLNEKDLDSATRELNQLKGAAKALLHDWLEAARRRLEVVQALEVIQAQATLASLLVI